MTGRWPGSHRRILLVSAAIAAAALLLLIVLTVQVAPPPTVTVTRAEVVIVGQGSDAGGLGWFGPSPYNYSGAVNGFPFVFGVGETFHFSIQMMDNDARPHNLSAAAVAAPFALTGYTPTLPYYVEAHEDFLLDLAILMPAHPGTYVLMITLTTYG